MKPTELGYVVITSTDIDAWIEFAADVVGAMPVSGPHGTLRLRTDERSARVVIVPGGIDEYHSAGWIMRTEADFHGLRDRLVDAGVTVRPATDKERQTRHVTDLFFFSDPASNRHEVAYGPVAVADPYISPRGVRFVTGSEGMGHVVLPSGEHLNEVTDFWTQTVGLTRANSRTFPNGAKGSFFSCNGRQHSIAITEIDCPRGCLHIALEVGSLDDCGRTLDRSYNRKLVRRALGKHLNDNMVSFYIDTPGGFQLEYGFADGTPAWRPDVFFEDGGGSYWGHAFLD